MKRNTFRKGITEAEYYGTNPMSDTGVPLMGFRGVPVDQGRGQFGIPIPGQGPIKKAEAPRCHGMTKKGEPCKAAPMKEGDLCYGHQKQSDAN